MNILITRHVYNLIIRALVVCRLSPTVFEQVTKEGETDTADMGISEKLEYLYDLAAVGQVRSSS